MMKLKIDPATRYDITHYSQLQRFFIATFIKPRDNKSAYSFIVPVLIFSIFSNIHILVTFIPTIVVYNRKHGSCVNHFFPIQNRIVLLDYLDRQRYTF